MLSLDHLVYVVPDLDASVAEIERTYGMTSLPGGIHPEGTSNRLIPLRDSQYLEFITVHDPDACQEDDVGRAVLALMASGGGLAWWGLRTDRIEDLAARLGLSAVPGSIQDPTGETIASWRVISPLDDLNGALPFFVQYDQSLADRAVIWDARYEEASHESGVTSFAWVEVSVGEPELRNWIDEPSLPVRISSGPAGLRGVGLNSPAGEIIIRTP